MKDLVVIKMTPQEYEEYRNYQKLKVELAELDSQKDKMIIDIRDQYVNEFNERQTWAKRATLAEKKLDKLVKIVHSSMPTKLRFEQLCWELEHLDVVED